MTNNGDLQRQLVAAALAARTRAYAPYSQFLVGAAIATLDEQIFTGCNVENASYGLTICAERNAVFQAVAAGHRQFAAIALAASQGVTPCGACRQVLAEFANRIPVWIVDPDSPATVNEFWLDELLPSRFVLKPPSCPP